MNPVEHPQSTDCETTYDTQSNFGLSVATAGDVDGDGFDDVLAAQPGTSAASRTPAAVCIYFGSASGVSAGSKGLLVPPHNLNPVERSRHLLRGALRAVRVDRRRRERGRRRRRASSARRTRPRSHSAPDLLGAAYVYLGGPRPIGPPRRDVGPDRAGRLRVRPVRRQRRRPERRRLRRRARRRAE